MWYEDALELALEDEGLPYDPDEEEWDAAFERWLLEGQPAVEGSR